MRNRFLFFGSARVMVTWELGVSDLMVMIPLATGQLLYGGGGKRESGGFTFHRCFNDQYGETGSLFELIAKMDSRCF